MKRLKRRDRYYRRRGATATILRISCSQCKTRICEYQKDGNGNLHRMYLDRIISPVAQFQIPEYERGIAKSQLPNLVCTCRNVIAVPMIHKKEGRLAFRIIFGSIHKHKI